MIQSENTPKEGKWQQLNSDDRAKIEHLLSTNVSNSLKQLSA